MGFGPVWLMAPEPVPELGVFLAGAGQHGHESAAVAGDVVHGGPVGELAVGHIQEVGPPDQGPKLVPGGDVGDIVGGVAVLDPERDGHGPVSGDGENAQQLLEVGAVVLVVSVGDRRDRLRAPGPARRAAVIAREGDGGRVVVQLGEFDGELPHHGQDHLGDHTGPVCVEETIEHASHPVVVQGVDVSRVEAEQARFVGGGPLGEGVDRLVRDDQVADHHCDHRGGSEPQPGVVRAQVSVQNFVQAHAGQEVVDDRQRSDGLAG